MNPRTNDDDRAIVQMLQRLREPLFLLLRLCFGYLFFTIGLGKLGDLHGTTEFFAKLGIPFASANAVFVGGVQTVGGLLMFLGLCSRPVAFLLIGNMLVAYATAHTDTFGSLRAIVGAPPFPFIVTSMMVLVNGAGRWSVDALLRGRAGAQQSRNVAMARARA